MRLIICLFVSSLLISSIEIKSQCNVIPNAIQGINYTFIQSGGTNASGIAYNPNLNIYYAVIAGNSSFPLETFDATGVSLYQTNTGFDCRGLWWNPNLNQLETNGFNTWGIHSFNLDNNGYALNTGFSFFPGLNQPTAQSCGDLDFCTNEILYFNNGVITHYNRSTNNLIGNYPLTGIPTGLTNINSSSIIYTGCSNKEIGILDATNKKIYFFNKQTGVFTGESQLPNSAVTNNSFRFSYANNLAWLYDVSNRTWTSFQVLNGSNLGSIDLGTDTTICQGNTLTLDMTMANTSYLWQDGSTNSTFVVTQPGTYWLETTNFCGTAIDTISVSYATPPDINLGNDTSICQGETLVLDVVCSNCTYFWQNNSTDSICNVTQPGIYWVQASNSCGAMTDSILVSYSNPPTISLGSDTILCFGETLTLNAFHANASYLWQDNSSDSTFIVDQPGIYWVILNSTCGTSTDTIEVTYETDLPEVNLGKDSSICKGSSLTLNLTNTHSTFIWQDSSTNSSYTIDQTGTYWVFVTNSCGTTSDSINFTECDCNVFIPNAFTPNNSSLNDLFIPKSVCNFVEFRLLIFDRWGTIIFETEDENEAWDGKYKGKYCNEGIYVYRLEYSTTKITNSRQFGHVTLLR